MPDLKPCPFCGAPAFITPVARDWWRLQADHHDECIFPEDHRIDVPQLPQQLDLLIRDWNRRAPDDRLAAQLRECAETLGADQIDEQRAMRAYADAIALLDEMPHISRITGSKESLMEH